jgi:putative ABC transport system permease protein
LRISDYYHMAFKALRDRKLRSALTILGIVIGCSLIVALVASTSGLNANVQAQIDKIGVTTLNVASTSQRTPITDDDIAIVKNFVGVQDVIPYFQRRLSINYGSNSLSVNVIGFDQTKLLTLYKGLTFADGTTVDGFDPTGAVIGTEIANPPADSGFPPVEINEMVSIQGTTTGKGAPPTYTFIAKGIMTPYGTVGFTNLDECIFTSMAARTLFGIKYYSGIYVIAESPDVVNDVLASIQSYFGGNARVFSSTAMLQTVQSITGSLTLFLGGVAAVTLVVAAVGIANTMFVSVMERTREIGIMKAIGYRPKQILSLFLSEAALTGVAGAIVGTLFGIFLSYLLGGNISSSFTFAPRGFSPGARSPVQSSGTSYSPVFSTQLFAFSLIFPIILAVLAGFYPAWRASRMNAVLALKYE